jgi:hypothetical protein
VAPGTTMRLRVEPSPVPSMLALFLRLPALRECRG